MHWEQHCVTKPFFPSSSLRPGTTPWPRRCMTGATRAPARRRSRTTTAASCEEQKLLLQFMSCKSATIRFLLLSLKMISTLSYLLLSAQQLSVYDYCSIIGSPTELHFRYFHIHVYKQTTPMRGSQPAA